MRNPARFAGGPFARPALALGLATAILALSPVRAGAEGDPVRERILGRAFTDGQVRQNLTHICDRIGGRLAGTRAGVEAEEYAAWMLRSYGLDAVGHEEFEMLGWERGEMNAAVTTPVRRRLGAIALGNTPSSPPEGVHAVVVDLGFGTPAEFEAAGDAVRGKIALVRDGAPPGHRGVHRSEKMTLSERHGAVAMVLVNGTPGNVPQAGTCSMGKISDIPGIGVSREEGDWLGRLAGGHDEVRLRIRVVNRHGPAKARNVVGEIRGETDEIVIVGAHLDSWDLAQGTIDNGTGTAVVLEMARILGGLDGKPRRTVRFVLFMGEELGLYGSRAYVKQHADELDRIAFLLNLDMVGRPTGLRLGGVDAAVPLFEDLAASLHELGVRPGVENRAGLHSDHQPFLVEGVPTGTIATRLEDDQARYYHSAGDTLDKARFADLQQCAAVGAVVLWKLATVEERPGPRLAPDQVREILIRDGLREALELSGSWTWDD